MIHNEEKYQSIERDSKKQIRELAGKDPKNGYCSHIPYSQEAKEDRAC